MKTNALAARLNTLLVSILLIYACKKSITDYSGNGNIITQQQQHQPADSILSETADTIPFPAFANFDCPHGPDYGDSIIYPQPTTLLNDYMVQPVSALGSGKYFAWPGGLQIDPNTGVIDVTKSTTGTRYTIGFVKKGKSDTCLTNLILAGASYMDSVYVIGANQKKANPFFDANPLVPSMCGSSSSGGPGCQWDITGAAKLMNIAIDNNTGIIDLEKTLNDKAFGAIPLNGTVIQSDFNYQLNDASNMAVQHMTIQFMYYDKKSNIPQAVLDQINSRRNNILQDLLIVLSGGKPKPPLIVITRSN
ncbi:MAG: hypothetical protein ACHQET_02860 [Chitinophagales bacterium]